MAPSPFDTRTVTATPRTSGRAISAAIAAGMLVDGALKVMHTAHTLHGMGALGYPPTTVTLIGAIAMACAQLYTIPPTAPAWRCAAHCLAGAGMMAWLGLLLREPQWMRVRRSTRGRAPDGR